MGRGPLSPSPENLVNLYVEIGCFGAFCVILVCNLGPTYRYSSTTGGWMSVTYKSSAVL